MNYSAEKINRYVQEGRMEQLIEIAESRHLLQFEQLYKLLEETNVPQGNAEKIPAILVTGPSSSGKTTFASRLAKHYREEGYSCTVISIDDYYRNREEIHRLQEGGENGFYDYETLEAFDIAFFREQMEAFLSGETISLPRYDFPTGSRQDGGRLLTPSGKDMIVVEGIHALNPAFCEGLPFGKTLRVYICPFDFYGADGNELVVRPQEIRFMRRAIRDRVHRNSDLICTMEMWPSVRKGEEQYIKPMKRFADFFFDSSLEYEIVCLKKRLLDMTTDLDAAGWAKLRQFVPLDALEHFVSCDKLSLPEDSIFQEFYR